MSDGQIFKEKAYAKVNLNLHVLGRRLDGYHELESLVCFPEVCDLLNFQTHSSFSLSVQGPWAKELQGGGQNLIEIASQRFLTAFDGAQSGAFTLTKFIPVAAGLGGGSADAAAALRLLARANGIDVAHPTLMQIAKGLGADVPVCLRSRACVMRGEGHDMGSEIQLPSFYMVLMNPRVEVSTANVFQNMALELGSQVPRPPMPQVSTAIRFCDLVELLEHTRNDLLEAACAQAPVIAELLHALKEQGGFARMSGSGATVFGLFETCADALRVCKMFNQMYPQMWVRHSAVTH